MKLGHWFLCKEPVIDISLRHPEDAPALQQMIRQTPHAIQRDRLRAIELAIAGQSTPAIMQMLGRSRGFVQRWCYVYRDQGLPAVVPKSPTGRPPKLPVEQYEAFKQRVLAGPKSGVAGEADDGVCALRGRDFIRILKEEFGVSYQLSGVYDLLDRLNLSVLVPRPQHRKSDPQAMAQWVEDAPFLSAKSSEKTRKNKSQSGSRTKLAPRKSASKAR